MLYLMAYDIADNKRRRKVVRVLQGYGERLHESAFLCSLRPAQFSEVAARLQAVLHIASDRIRVYPLCSRDAPDPIAIGACVIPIPTHHYIV